MGSKAQYFHRLSNAIHDIFDKIVEYEINLKVLVVLSALKIG